MEGTLPALSWKENRQPPSGLDLPAYEAFRYGYERYSLIGECKSCDPRIWTPKQPSTFTDSQQWGRMAPQRCWLTEIGAPGQAWCSDVRPVSWLSLFLCFEVWPFPQSVYFEQTLAYSSNLRVWWFSKTLPDRGKPPLLRLPEAVGCEALPALIVQWVRMLSSCRTVVS